MKNIPQEAIRQFLIGISKNRLDSSVSYDEAFSYIYLRSNGTKDIYERVVRLAFTTLARNNRGLSKNPNYDKIHNEAQAFLIKQIKSINVSIKHLAIYGSGITDSYYEFAHVPVDSYIISGLKNNIDCTFGQDPKHYISISIRNKKAPIAQGL